jgi:hypothetical protein
MLEAEVEVEVEVKGNHLTPLNFSLDFKRICFLAERSERFSNKFII